jgi:hypothetical protein
LNIAGVLFRRLAMIAMHKWNKYDYSFLINVIWQLLYFVPLFTYWLKILRGVGCLFTAAVMARLFAISLFRAEEEVRGRGYRRAERAKRMFFERAYSLRYQIA